MKRILAIVIVGLCLAGCAQLQKFQQSIAAAMTVYQRVSTATVPGTTISAVASIFDGIKSVSTTYFQYCKMTPAASICAPGTPTSPGPLRLAIKYVRDGTKARNQLEPYIVSGGAGPGDIYNVLVDSINGLNSLSLTQTGG